MRALALMALGAALLAPTAHAQHDGAGVLLRVHPRVGDTLRTRLEQQTDVSAMLPGASGRPLKSVSSSVTLNARTVVRASSPASTLVVTIVDSATLRTSDVRGAAQVAAAERALRGQQLLLQIGADGTVENVRDERGIPVPRDVIDAMSAMPAVFPRRPVMVGDQWTRELPLPAAGPLGVRGANHVHAVFRLDSLDRSGNLAFVSLRGEILPDAKGQGVELSGGVTGSMQVDRQRGWMTDSRFTVTVRSMVTPAPSSGLAPMRFVTHVTQRLRTMDKR